jgi:hypothetical protein
MLSSSKLVTTCLPSHRCFMCQYWASPSSLSTLRDSVIHKVIFEFVSNFAAGTGSPWRLWLKIEEVRSRFSNKRNETTLYKIPRSMVSNVFCAHASFIFCLHSLPYLRPWSYLHCTSNWKFRYYRYRLSLSLFIFSSSVLLSSQ